MSKKRAAILDAGSSGTRIFVYEWDSEGSGPPCPKPAKFSHANKDGGLSKVTPDLESVKQYFEDMFRRPGDLLKDHEAIPLFVLATAGMRDLEAAQPERYEELCQVIGEYLPTAGFQTVEFDVITGKQEALYGWVASNHSLKYHSAPGIQHTGYDVGYLEMGGSSAQIAFALTESEKRDYDGNLTRVNMGDGTVDLYLRSYPLGGNKAWHIHNETLLRGAYDSHGNPVKVEDPARPKHRKPASSGSAPAKTWETKDMEDIYKAADGKIITGEIIGTSSFWRTEYIAHLVLQHLQGVKQLNPADYPPQNSPDPPYGSRTSLLEKSSWINFFGGGRQFVGGAHFWYTTRAIFGLDADGKPKTEPYSWARFYDEVVSKSTWTWESLVELNVNPKFLEKAFFMAAWVMTVLCEGFGFPYSQAADSTNFQPYQGNKGSELTWTLGKIVLYARDVNETDIVVVKTDGTVVQDAVWSKDDEIPQLETE